MSSSTAPAGLAGDFAGFHRDGVLTPLEGLADFVEHAHVLSPGQSVRGWQVQATSRSPEATWQNTMPFQRNSDCGSAQTISVE
jgi:hypothetical protein